MHSCDMPNTAGWTDHPEPMTPDEEAAYGYGASSGDECGSCRGTGRCHGAMCAICMGTGRPGDYIPVAGRWIAVSR